MSVASLADPCTPSLYMGFAGSDANRRTFQSGYQISRVDAFSLVHYYQLAADKVCLTAHQRAWIGALLNSEDGGTAAIKTREMVVSPRAAARS